jgi:hypothetical protein
VVTWNSVVKFERGMNYKIVDSKIPRASIVYYLILPINFACNFLPKISDIISKAVTTRA